MSAAMNDLFHVANFYKFHTVGDESLPQVKNLLEVQGERLSLSGLIILADEGVNGTVAGAADAVEEFKRTLPELFETGDWTFKNATAEKDPFKRFKVKIRAEIVTTGAAEPIEVGEPKNALSPREWHEVLSSEEEVLLLDTRNYYETELGMFKGANDPKLINFQQFGEYIDKQDIPRDKKVLMYCTGGIRCEKAIFEMEQRGFNSVYQLHGGILNYLKEYPDELFDGECFVFDQRVSVTQDLSPSSTYVFCPHCGQPGKIEVTCDNCAVAAKICHRCEGQENTNTCSKDCANQLSRKKLRQNAAK